MKVSTMIDGDSEAAHVETRNWSSAIELVAEAQQAVRDCDERTSTAERYSRELDQHYREKIKRLEGRIAAAEKKIESADARAKQAEVWMEKFKRAIEDGFGGYLEAK